MEATVIIALLALLVSVASTVYKVGRDSKGKTPADDGKLDQIIKSIDGLNDKMDKMSEWQQSVAAIHASHSEQIKTLFERVGRVEDSTEERKKILQVLGKLLDRKD